MEMSIFFYISGMCVVHVLLVGTVERFGRRAPYSTHFSIGTAKKAFGVSYREVGVRVNGCVSVSMPLSVPIGSSIILA